MKPTKSEEKTRHDYVNQCWGHAISHTDKVKDRDGAYLIMGHGPMNGFGLGPNMIKPGDEITRKMQSGNIGVFVCESIEYFSDPNDMFKGVFLWSHYADEEPTEVEVPE